MRPLVRALLLALAVPAAAAGDPPVISLKVGEERSLGGGTAPICDNPSVAIITADGRAILRAIGPGETLCSFASASSPGMRPLYRIVVVKADAAKPK